jgi:hypothetical protein
MPDVSRKSSGIIGKHIVTESKSQRSDIVSQAAQRYMVQFSSSSLAAPKPAATDINNPNASQVCLQD